jgi:hypothetical protein
MRAGLTILGVVMGIMTVIDVVDRGRLERRTMTKQIEGLGSNVIFVRPSPGRTTVEERRRRRADRGRDQTIGARCPT